MRFTPNLTDAEIRKEAVRMVTKRLEAKAREEYERRLIEREKEEQLEKKMANVKGSKNTKPSPKGKQGKKQEDNSKDLALQGPTPVNPPTEEEIDLK